MTSKKDKGNSDAMEACSRGNGARCHRIFSHCSCPPLHLHSFFPYPIAMQSIITGRAYVLGDNIDTDQIIPAQYLSFNPSLPEERKFFGMYALSSVPEKQAGLPAGNTRFVPENQFKSPYSIVIGGKNFGCGS